MKMEEKLIDQLIVDEGLRLKPYRCTAGKLTIGVGRNLDDNWLSASEIKRMLWYNPLRSRRVKNAGGPDVKTNLIADFTQYGITVEEARYLLQNDITAVKSQLRAAMVWFDSQPEDVQLVLCNMGFNLGISGLLRFKNFLAAVKGGKYATAAEHMLSSQWAGQVGNRAVRLANIMRNI